MPPKSKFTRKEIITAAVAVAREKGMDAVTARGVAARLGASPKVIFGLFQNMEELQDEVMQAAHRIYQGYITGGSSQYPPYKASGMGYILFAKEEKELFKLIFMRDRTGEPVSDDQEELAPILAMIQQSTGMTRERAFFFHLEMWVFVHGIATMLATNYLQWEDGMISNMLTDAFEGVKARFLGGGQHDSDKDSRTG